MGRDATVTADQVNAMADTITAEGGKPTSRAIRERLGNTGSMGTINRLLQSWRANRAVQQTSTLSMPPALQNTILDFIASEVASARATLEIELLAQQQEAADLATENERQLETITALKSELVTIAAEKASAEGQTRQLINDLAAAHHEALQERLAFDQARTELAKAQMRLEALPQLSRELEALRTELQNERQAATTAERQAAVLQAQKEDLQSRAGGADAEITRLRGQLDTQGRAHTEQLQSQHALAAAELERMRAEASERVMQARAEASRLLEQVTQMQNRMDAMSGELSKAFFDAKKAAEEAAVLRGRLAGRA